MVWEILILKILAVRPSGEATTAEISRDLAIVDRGVSRVRGAHTIDGGLFGAKLITSPQRGIWRISEQGRHYLSQHMMRENVPVQLAAE